MAGKIHIGTSNYQGGRAGDPPANALAQKLRALPFRTGRLKTGTPPRIAGNSINFSELEKQLVLYISEKHKILNLQLHLDYFRMKIFGQS